MTPQPAGYRLLTDVELNQRLPDDVLAYNVVPGDHFRHWGPSAFAGQVIPEWGKGLCVYAAPIADSAQEAGAGDDPEAVFWEHLPEALSKTKGGDEPCRVNSITPVSNRPAEVQPLSAGQRDPNYDELKAAREERDDLRAAWEEIFASRPVNGMSYRDAAKAILARLTTAETHAKSLEGRVENQVVVFQSIGRIVGVPENNDSCTVLIGAVRSMAARLKDSQGVIKLYQEAYEPDGHSAPHDCFATGPLTGNPIADYVVCPGCVASKAATALLRPATAGPEVQP